MKSVLYALTRYQEDDYSSQIRLFTTMDKAREEFIKTIRNLNAEGMNVSEDAERFDDERNFHECVDRLEYKNTHEDDGADWAVVFLLEPDGDWSFMDISDFMDKKDEEDWMKEIWPAKDKLYALTCYHQSDDSNLIRLFTSLDKARWEFTRTIREINDEGARQPEEAEQFDDSKSFKKCIKQLDYESCDSGWALVFSITPDSDQWIYTSYGKSSL